MTRAALLRHVSAAAVVCLTSFLVALAIVSENVAGHLSRPEAVAQVVLLLAGGTAILGVRQVHGANARFGPGVYVASVAFGFALLLGLRSGGQRLTEHRTQLAVLFALAVGAFVAGATTSRALPRARVSSNEFTERFDPVRTPFVLWSAVILLGLALLNLATGSIPLLAPNIDGARFAGSGGVFAQFWTWIIGGLEWLLIVAGGGMLLRRRGVDRLSVTIALLCAGVLALLASRSFLLIVALSLLVSYAVVRRVTATKLLVLALAGLVSLGFSGALRIQHSDPTGARKQYLRSQQIDSIYGLISQSAAVGPSVFASTLDSVPSALPYQHGRFALRDLRALLPLHPFGRPDRSDIWITKAILHRDPGLIGGSPPTLVGGLYIDFGVFGVAIGSFLIGFALVSLYRWARRAGTFGALIAYSYASAYVALSAYSYVSVKPTVLTVAALSLALHRIEVSRAA
jgi:oligosaccharide repeat unit polymerase